ncbi:MAG: TIGR04255 family protein, partial [Ignavibacteriaceae bacterium]
MSDQVIPRSIYKINPLMTVVCQFRFPPILTIDTEVPSKFQEKIRTKFPQYSEVPGFAQQLVPMSFPNINNPPLFGQPSIKNHQFLSSDNDLVVNLTRTFITLQTSKYKSWEPFIENFKFILSSLVETYRPAYFTRIGLRYINLLNRSKLGLANTRWKELIQPAYLGLLSTSINDKIKS